MSALYSGHSTHSPHASEAPRTNRVLAPLDWARRRRAEKARQRTEARVGRVTRHVASLGPRWRVLDPEPADSDFITIGPGGIFAVAVCDHGREKVMVAGDVVQVGGARPPLVANARREAIRVSGLLSQAAGRRLPVIPVVAFHGHAEIIYYGRPPRGCVVTGSHDLSRALDAHGTRLGPAMIDELYALARRPGTWLRQRA